MASKAAAAASMQPQQAQSVLYKVDAMFAAMGAVMGQVRTALTSHQAMVDKFKLAQDGATQTRVGTISAFLRGSHEEDRVKADILRIRHGAVQQMETLINPKGGTWLVFFGVHKREEQLARLAHMAEAAVEKLKKRFLRRWAKPFKAALELSGSPSDIALAEHLEMLASVAGMSSKGAALPTGGVGGAGNSNRGNNRRVDSYAAARVVSRELTKALDRIFVGSGGRLIPFVYIRGSGGDGGGGGGGGLSWDTAGAVPVGLPVDRNALGADGSSGRIMREFRDPLGSLWPAVSAALQSNGGAPVHVTLLLTPNLRLTATGSPANSKHTVKQGVVTLMPPDIFSEQGDIIQPDDAHMARGALVDFLKAVRAAAGRGIVSADLFTMAPIRNT